VNQKPCAQSGGLRGGKIFGENSEMGDLNGLGGGIGCFKDACVLKEEGINGAGVKEGIKFMCFGEQEKESPIAPGSLSPTS